MRYKCYFLHHASIALCHGRTASAPRFAAHVTLVRDCPQARPSSLAGRPRRSTGLARLHHDDARQDQSSAQDLQREQRLAEHQVGGDGGDDGF